MQKYAAREEPGDLLAAADGALYRAKAAGGRGEHAAVPQPEGASQPAWRAFDHAAEGNAG
jgi:hypothetical protein